MTSIFRLIPREPEWGKIDYEYEENFDEKRKEGIEKAEEVFPEKERIVEDSFVSKFTEKTQPIDLARCTQALFEGGYFERLDMRVATIHAPKLDSEEPQVIPEFPSKPCVSYSPIWKEKVSYGATFVLLRLISPEKLIGYAICKAHPSTSLERLKVKREGSDFLYLISNESIAKIDIINKIGEVYGEYWPHFKMVFTMIRYSGVDFFKDFEPNFLEISLIGRKYECLTTQKALDYLKKELDLH